MATPKVTKEQLVVEVARLRDSHSGWVAGDERRRKEFAKAFGWMKNTRYDVFNNHTEHEPQLPSWEEIFVQVGKLLVLEELKNKVIRIPFPFDIPEKGL